MEATLILSKLNKSLTKCKSISKDISDLRILFNFLCKSKINYEDLDYIKGLNSNILLKANKELNKKDTDMKILNDMVVTEYALDHIESSDFYDEEEEIY